MITLLTRAIIAKIAESGIRVVEIRASAKSEANLCPYNILWSKYTGVTQVNVFK